MDEKIYTFPVTDRQGERKDDYNIQVTADNERDALILAVSEAIYPEGHDDDVPTAQEMIEEELGADWTPEKFYAVNPDFWRGDTLVSVHAPIRTTTPENAPRAVMRRCVDRYYDEGMFTHLRGRLRMVIDALSDSEVERIFSEDLHTQREMEAN